MKSFPLQYPAACENGLAMVNGVFGGSEDESVQRLLNALKSNQPALAYDEQTGIIDLNQTGSRQTNGVEINNGSWGAKESAPIMNEGGITMKSFQPNCCPAACENGLVMANGAFGGSEDESVQRLLNALKSNQPALAYDEQTGIIDLNQTGSNQTNGVEINNGKWGASQWYEKDPGLLKTEVLLMQKKFPSAKIGVLDDGTLMYTMNLHLGIPHEKKWKIALLYDRDHPHNHCYGGSVHVALLSPTLKELHSWAVRQGYKGVPHLLQGRVLDGRECPYLCTRVHEDVEDGAKKASSGVTAVGWAAEWAATFEGAMRDRDIWNQFCDDDHYRDWQV